MKRVWMIHTNTGIGRNSSIFLESMKCSEETNPDYSTYVPVEELIDPGKTLLVSNGTMPCFGPDGIQLNFSSGDKFGGRLYYGYKDASTNYSFVWYGRLNFDAVAKPS